MNWGKGIIIGMAAFMGFILFLVISLMQHKVDLVSEDYYQREIDYNQHFDAVAVYRQSGETIAVRTTPEHLEIHIPERLLSDSIRLEFKRPDNEQLDFKLGIRNRSALAIPLNKLHTGRYDLTVHGKLQGKAFIFEESVTIP